MKFSMIGPPVTWVGGRDGVEQVVRRCMDTDLLGVDTETLGLLKNPDTGRSYDKMTDQVVVMGLCPDSDSRFLVPRRLMPHFKGLLESDVPKALTNIKFDAHRIMNTAGISLGGKWVDTIRLDILLDEDTREYKHSLKKCMWDYFGIQMAEYKDLFGKLDPRVFEPGHEMWEKYLDYSSLDPWATRKLALFQLQKLRSIQVWASKNVKDLEADDITYTMEDLYYETEEEDLKTLWRMERRGVGASRSRLAEIEESLGKEMVEIAGELNRRMGAPFNPNSNQQIGKFLFDGLGLSPRSYTATGQPQTDERTLRYFAERKGVEECELIVKYRKASKLKGTYAQGLRKWMHKDERIHTSYSTKNTGRLGSADPNLQNIPRPDNDPHGIRAAIVPDGGNVLIVNDYSQLEMRIMAYEAWCYGDGIMLDAIRAGLDMHSRTACEMMGCPYEDFIALKKAGDPEAKALRTASKKVGFGIIYGITEYKLAEQLSEALGRPVSEQEALSYIDMYLTSYPGVRAYVQDTQRHAYEHGYVQTLLGRYRRLSALKGNNKKARGHAERQAINARIQGSAADIVKRAMHKCENDEYLRETLGFKLIHQVHDELLFEGPRENSEEAAAIIQQHMEHPLSRDLPVPLEAIPVIVDNWASAKD